MHRMCDSDDCGVVMTVGRTGWWPQDVSAARIASWGLPCWLSWWRIYLQCRRPWLDSWLRKIPWRRDRLPTPVFLGFPGGSAGKESACNAGDLGLIPGLGRSHGEGNGYPLQYSGLENSMDKGAWQATVHGVAKSQTQLSNFHAYTDLSLDKLF